MCFRILAIILIATFAQQSYGQSVLDESIQPAHVGLSLSDALQNISKASKSKFYYIEEWVSDFKIVEDHVGERWGTVMETLFSETGLSYIEMYPNLVVIIKDPTQQVERQKFIEKAMSSGFQLDNLRLGNKRNVSSDSLLTFAGYLSNWSTGEPLPFVPIAVNGGTYVAETDVSGRFQVSLPQGEYLVSISYLGFTDKIINLQIYESGEVEISMEEEYTQLEEVVIQGKQVVEMSAADIGKSVLDIESIKKSPALLGAPDIIKQVQALAGVTSVGEASGGFNVRGGSVDQNLVLYDGLPQFNSAHALGFLNGFNADAIQKVTFLKGGISARYGGRASSILDIQSADGQKDLWRGRLGVGIITSHASAAGPIKKDTSSLAVSLRSTYSDWLVRSIETDFQSFKNSTVGFLDATAKYHHKLKNNRHLRISSYGSYDQFGLTADTTYRWNNLQLGAQYEVPINKNVNANLTLGANRYGYTVDNKKERTASELKFNVATISLLSDFVKKGTSNTLNFGFHSRLFRFTPGQLRPTNDISNAAVIDLDKQTVIENALYVSDQIEVNDKLFITAGLRFPYFVNFGPEDINLFEENSSRNVVDITGIKSIGAGNAVKSYFNIEPRLALRYLLAERTALKLGYNRMNQYLHLISSTAAVAPVDIWKPSDYYLKPQQSDQVSLGFSTDIGEQAIGFNTEVFYKRINNAVDFKPGARLILNDNLETELIQGKGRAYGLEVSLQKPKGRFTGTLNYTYARSFRTYDSEILGLQINAGQEYPSNFDQPHVANLTWNYNMTRRYIFSGTFSFRKGRPITLPLGAFNLEQTSLAFFSDRNQYRIPDYHRLDLALIIQGNHKRNRKAKGFWSLSIYNVYGRKNPYSIFYKNGNAGVPKPFKLAVIGIPLPSISYNLEWK